MTTHHPPTFLVNYGTVHSHCGNTLKKSDFRIQSYETLNLIAKPDGSYQPLQIYCNHCQETVTATTMDIWLSVNLSAKEILYEVPIEKIFSHREKIDAAYMEGLKMIH